MPKVAAAPTYQKMLSADTPVPKMTWLDVAVVNAAGTWKRKTGFVIPLALKVTLPVIPSA